MSTSGQLRARGIEGEGVGAVGATSGSGGGSGWLIDLCVVLMALAPYLTLELPFGLGMRVQAGLILLLLGTLSVVGRERLRHWLAALPPVPRWALAAWVVSAAWGTAVGLCTSNPSRHVVGQFVAMLLLPAAALAFGAQPLLTGSRIATGLSVAATAAAGVHLVAFALRATPAQRHGEPLRLMLANDISPSGLAPAALLFVAAWWWVGLARRGWVGFAGSLVLVGGSMSRGAWFVSLAGLAALAVWASYERGLVVIRRRLLVAGACAIVLVGLATTSRPGAIAWTLNTESLENGGSSGWVLTAVTIRGRRALAVPAMDASQERVLVAGLRVATPAMELTCLTVGPRDGGARLTVRGYDDRGEIVVRSDVGLGTGYTWARADRVVLLPPEVTSVSVALWAGGDGWYVSEVAVREVNGALRAWLRTAQGRLLGLGRLLSNPTGDANVLYRGKEAAAVTERWRQASLARVLLGHGLGASYAFSNPSYDERGDRIFLPTASYIHNFYLFLAFKLGVAGLVALAALLGFVLWSAAQASRRARSPDDRWVSAATAVVFGAYLVWGVSSPGIIDFRVAPLLGAMLAASQAGGGCR